MASKDEVDLLSCNTIIVKFHHYARLPSSFVEIFDKRENGLFAVSPLWDRVFSHSQDTFIWLMQYMAMKENTLKRNLFFDVFSPSGWGSISSIMLIYKNKYYEGLFIFTFEEDGDTVWFQRTK